MNLLKKNSSNFVKSITIVVLFIQSLNLFAQPDTIYADENDKIISKSVYEKKMNSSIYNGFRYKTDSVVLEKLRLKYCFGKLTPIVRNQFFKFLNHRHQIDTTKTLVISYNDTLRAKTEYPIKYISIRNNNDIKEHIKTYEDFISANKRVATFHKRHKKKLTYLNFYYYNNGHPEVYKNLRWYKDYGRLIKKIFTHLDNNSIRIILHQDGEFYIESTETNLPYTDLIKKRNWFKHKNKFIKEVEELNKYE